MILAIVFLITSISLILLDQQHQLEPIKGVLARISTPVQGPLSQAGKTLSGLTENFRDQGELRTENERLRAAVEYLTAENVRMVELQRENEDLRRQLGFKQAHPTLIGLPVEIIGREPSGSINYIEVDKGSNAGVKKGMPVVDSAGLVGQVMEVEPERSRILLIVDISSSVPAKIQNSRADGIVEGAAQRGGQLLMKFIPQGEQVQPGDWVITSNLGGVFPQGLPIGKVTKVNQKDSDMTQEAEVAPVVSFSRLETVTIVIGEQ